MTSKGKRMNGCPGRKISSCNSSYSPCLLNETYWSLPMVYQPTPLLMFYTQVDDDDHDRSRPPRDSHLILSVPGVLPDHVPRLESHLPPVTLWCGDTVSVHHLWGPPLFPGTQKYRRRRRGGFAQTWRKKESSESRRTTYFSQKVRGTFTTNRKITEKLQRRHNHTHSYFLVGSGWEGDYETQKAVWGSDRSKVTSFPVQTSEVSRTRPTVKQIKKGVSQL